MKLNIQKTFAKYLLRSGRGSGLVNHLTDLPRDALDGTVYLFAIEGIFNMQIPFEFLIVIIILKKVIEYLIGALDERVGFWKVENEYASRQLNPFNQEMLNRIQNIEKCVCDQEIKHESINQNK